MTSKPCLMVNVKSSQSIYRAAKRNRKPFLTLLAISTLFLFHQISFATDVIYPLIDFQNAPAAVKQVELYPLNNPSVSGSNIVSKDRRTATTSSGGVATFTNVVMPGCYRVVFHGAYTTTEFTNCFDADDATNAAINGATRTTNQVAVTALTASHFVLSSNGTAFSLTSSNTTLNGNVTFNGVTRTNWPTSGSSSSFTFDSDSSATFDQN